jgi:hypothetical protein
MESSQKAFDRRIALGGGASPTSQVLRRVEPEKLERQKNMD